MKRYALLDTDFISKTHSVQDDGGNHLIDRVMELPEYEFFCHAQIVTELNRYNADADFGSCLPVKETRLFLADVDYVSIGNANRARTITPSTVAVFLQINLWIVQAKSDGSEKPPLKIGVSNCLLYDGFFLLPSCGRLNYI